MLLEDARLKIQRSEKHIADINSRIAALLEAQVATVEVDPKTGEQILKHDFLDKAALTDIALMLGDALHNLKCALDYTWMRTLERRLPSLAGSKFAKFPVRESLDELKAALEGRNIQVLAPDLFALLLNDVRPYSGGNFAVWPLHNLNIRDKHHLLIPAFAYASIEGIELKDQAGTVHPVGTWGTFEQPPYCLRFERRLNVKKKGKISAQILFSHAGKGAKDRSIHPDELRVYARCVLEIVKAFEGFLK